ncbi:MAG: UbiD family decarboxylase [Desulfurococcaceae archaeon]
MDLNGLKKYVKKLGKNLIETELPSPEYEITRLAYSNRNSTIISKLRGIDDIYIYTNLITSREDIVKILDASDLASAYMFIAESFNKRKSLITERFNEHFEEEDIDLSRIPFIKFYKEDGGYYLTSSIYIICFESICNASYHRTMYISKDKATLRIVPRHLNYLAQKYFERNKDAPVALVLGLDPLHEIAAAMSPPLGFFEVELGAVLGGEERIVRTPRYGIPVPANASIVVEGVISRDEVAKEGPFVDILMLVDSERDQPIFKLEHMYKSKTSPLVIHAIVPGLWEHQLLMGFPREALVYREVKRVVPCVEEVRLTEGGSTWLHGVLSVNKTCSEGDAKLAAITAIAAHPSIKHIIVVDNDVDIDNPLELEWAVATRVRGSRDIVIISDIRGSTLEPRSIDGIGDKVILLALTPRSDPWDKYKRVKVP